MASVRYPTPCTSAYCGKVLCDGCPVRPRMVQYQEAQGSLQEYEEGQERLRADKLAGRGIWARYERDDL